MIYRVYTSCFGIGFIKKAPGTFGSLPGLLLGVALSRFSLLTSVAILAIIAAAAYIAIQKVEHQLDSHDPSEIVIDEVIGQAIAVLWIEPKLYSLVLAFCLFRFFDILKPGPIGWVDKKIHGPLGTIGDDIIAGVFAGALALFLHAKLFL
ncbi:MAG: phosphatidylglycerophosphatase A [Pseudomonadota bacterium]